MVEPEPTLSIKMKSETNLTERRTVLTQRGKETICDKTSLRATGSAAVFINKWIEVIVIAGAVYYFCKKKL